MGAVSIWRPCSKQRISEFSGAAVTGNEYQSEKALKSCLGLNCAQPEHYRTVWCVHISVEFLQVQQIIHPKTSPGSTKYQPMATGTNIACQTYSNSTCQCSRVSGGVCWRLLKFWVLWRCLGGVWGVSWGIWVVFMEIWGARMFLVGIWVLHPCSMEL